MTVAPPPTQSTPEVTTKVGAMFMVVLRAVFLLGLTAVGWSLANEAGGSRTAHADLVLITFLAIGLIVIGLDVFVPRKSLNALAGLFFGLIVGMVVAYGLSLIVDLVSGSAGDLTPSQQSLITAVKLGIGVISCYLAVSFILQTKDDIRFVIPYVEFAKETKGRRPLILDTSVIIDGRILDIANTKILDAELVVPRFILQELQVVADSGDKLKRVRGRRGLDVLNKLQSSAEVEIRLLEAVPEKGAGDVPVDEMLVDLALQLNGKLVTNDYNLNKVAQVRGAPVININDLANALKPVVLPGESLSVKVIKPGEEIGQGVGYLDDGTMVVVEGSREYIGQNVELNVTSVLQTSAGRMIFGRMEGAVVAPERRRSR